MPFLIKTHENVTTAAKAILTERITPVIQVSNVTGEGLDLLRQLLRELPPRVTTLAAKGEAITVQGEVGAGIMSKAPLPAAAAAAADVTTTPAKAAGDAGATDVSQSVSAATGREASASAPGAPHPSIDLDAPGEAIIDSVFNVPGE